MKLVYQGKTKDVYGLDDSTYLLKFKDDATGENGVFDPGSNSVGLQISGMGKGSLRMSRHFFELFEKNGIPTHYISADPDNSTMNVKAATVFGKGVEVICRYRAVGSFFKRYGMYLTEGQELNALVEITLKDDARLDPLITPDSLEALGIMTIEEYGILKEMTKKIAGIVKDELAKKSLELYDIKFEFGRIGGQIVLIDEISGGNMRAYKGSTIVEPLDLAALFA